LVLTTGAGHFEIKTKQSLKLSKIPSKLKPRYDSENDYAAQLERDRARLEEFQTLLYANHARSMLIIFQGMDTAGKDGAIKHVMTGVNPQGCSVVSFKTPTSNELDHDYLWRVNRALPDRGLIGIFNRSYYEEALITRVHPELLKAERLPSGSRHDAAFWKFRYRDIVNYEKYLHRQGYEIVKIFIHISKDEQKRRLLDRFKDLKKNWKISEGDIRERGFWKQYQAAYEECIEHTSSKSSPWYIVPGDDKENARLIISRILADRFKIMDLKYPQLTKDEEGKLKNLKSLLAKE
jgi:PPK2 family polyphosphate:nucleotide phosphotransferase